MPSPRYVTSAYTRSLPCSIVGEGMVAACSNVLNVQPLPECSSASAQLMNASWKAPNLFFARQ